MQELARVGIKFMFFGNFCAIQGTLVDLEQANGFVWCFDKVEFVKIILNQLQHSVSLYEPGEETEQPHWD